MTLASGFVYFFGPWLSRVQKLAFYWDLSLIFLLLLFSLRISFFLHLPLSIEVSKKTVLQAERALCHLILSMFVLSLAAEGVFSYVAGVYEKRVCFIF